VNARPYRCPDYDGVSHLLSELEWRRRFKATQEPARFAMVQNDQDRLMFFRAWLRKVEQQGNQMKLAISDFEETERRIR